MNDETEGAEGGRRGERERLVIALTVRLDSKRTSAGNFWTADGLGVRVFSLSHVSNSPLSECDVQSAGDCSTNSSSSSFLCLSIPSLSHATLSGIPAIHCIALLLQHDDEKTTT